MIKVESLAFSYGSASVLDNITMTLEPGRIYGLLGENGVGKTTLLTLLCGLKKPCAGTISLDGQNPWERRPSFLQSVCYLPDEVNPVNQAAREWASEMGVFWPDFSLEKFLEAMVIFENDPSKKMNAMSAGQLKKTYISFSFASGARYLFMDEPTNALDIPGKSQFRRALLSFTPENSTIVISTHQVRDLENIIDPIIIMDKNDVLLNADICTISSKLRFDYGQVPLEGCLYAEQLPGGYIQVLPNCTGEESKVNIEALFNTAHLHKELIKNMFSHE